MHDWLCVHLALLNPLGPERYPQFEFSYEQENGHYWLTVTGPKGTKDYIDSANYLLNSSLNPRSTPWRKLQRGFRRLTQHGRVLPDFLIIGSMKSGTTSLYDYLTQHPAVYSASQKEIYFFNFNYGRGLNYYRSFFPTLLQKKVSQARHQQFMCGEATPFYIYHPACPERVKESLPQAKVIAILRNPIDRAYSHYQHRSRMGLERLSFAEAIAQEEERLHNPGPQAGPQAYYHRLVSYGYTTIGRYAEQLPAWFEQFPPEQRLILSTEALQEDPATTYRQTLDFLGLTPWQLAQFKKLNVAPYDPLPAPLRQQLADHFRPHNQRLYELLGRDLGWD